MAADTDRHRPAAHRAIFDGGIGTGLSVHFNGERFPALRAINLNVLNQIHRGKNISRDFAPRKLSLEFKPPGVAPKTFQAVVAPFFGMKKMDDHLSVIEYDPLAHGG